MRAVSIRFTALFSAFFLAISVFLPVFPVFASQIPANEKSPDERIAEMTEGIIAGKIALSPEEDIGKWLCAGAGNTTDWYAIALARQTGNKDITVSLCDYADSLICRVVRDNIGKSASYVERQRRTAALLACGVTDTEGKRDISRLISSEISETTGKQGVMSLIWGMILMNNTRSVGDALADITEKLLKMEISGGGWAVSGSSANPDVTAMAVQALAPQYNTDPRVRSAVDSALDFLSSSQLPDGDFYSYGTENSESAAQVTIALAALGTDPLSDPRFVKDGVTLLDAIEKYRLPSGGFEHTKGGGENHAATAQVLCALVALMRQRRGDPAFYDFSDAPTLPLDYPSADSTASSDNNGDMSESSDVNDDLPHTNGRTIWQKIRLPIAIIIILFLAVFLTVKAARGKLTAKNAACAAAAAGILILLSFLLNIETPDEYYARQTQPADSAAVGSVTVTVRVSDQAKELLPEFVEINAISVNISADSTAFDALTWACGIRSIKIDSTGSGKSVYVRAIGSTAEFDAGPASGWTYTVNGVRPPKSAGAVVLAPGDSVVWEFVVAQ
ncbi:MAG: DUF4430 domain-containing protein [Clostridia bacterium]|nr:DUF4430 domain-containing protein [Clostridia bacterium]